MDDIFYIPYDEIKVGDSASRTSVISDDIVMRFSQLIGDTNSFHVSDDSAKKTVFKTRIAHGVHLLAFISCLIGQELPGFGTIYCSHSFEFKRPVYIGESINVYVEVLEKLEHHQIKLATRITNGNDALVFDGVAVVKTYK